MNNNLESGEVVREYERGIGHHAAKLTEVDVRRIREAHASGDSFGAISRREGIAIGHIFRIVNRKAWRHVQ
jgi:hypothetical protein